jgi:hypothetical protein
VQVNYRQSGSWSGSDTDQLQGGRAGLDYAIGGNGIRLVVYHDFFTNRNMLEYRFGTSGTWNRVAYLGHPDTGNPAITTDSTGAMHLVEEVHDPVDYGITTLGYVKWTANAGSSTVETIDGSGYPGGICDIALDTQGRPHVSYYRSIGGNLMHAWRSNSGTWQTEVVDSSGDVGNRSSIAISADDVVYIAYNGVQNIKVAKKLTTGSWSIDTLAPMGYSYSSGTQVSLALDPNGSPQVVYFNGTTSEIRFFYYGP